MVTQHTPLRIKWLTLTDFRAFPGPAPAHFDLDGKNLLVYGENGAGKSSIFHALGGFFALKPPRALREHKNVFSGLPDADCRVNVEFTDGGAPVEWTVSSHPGSLRGKSPDLRVTEAALRRACLDYRSLLDTNYKQGAGPINLFDISVEHLLRDYPVTVSGRATTTMKLLVLDDVLIGLDHSNRLPVLDVLNARFADWQVVLLTHDRNWFDLARSHLPVPDWKCVEVYEGDNAAAAPIPVVRPTQNRPARALLEKAHPSLNSAPSPPSATAYRNHQLTAQEATRVRIYALPTCSAGGWSLMKSRPSMFPIPR